MEQSSTAWRMMLERAKLPEYARSSSAYIHGFLGLGDRVIRLYTALKCAPHRRSCALPSGLPVGSSVACAWLWRSRVPRSLLAGCRNFFAHHHRRSFGVGMLLPGSRSTTAYIRVRLFRQEANSWR